jgi:D-galacturonate reductase
VVLPKLRVGMVGLGMIFRETYLPVFENALRSPRISPEGEPYQVEWMGAVSRTGKSHAEIESRFKVPCFAGNDGLDRLLALKPDVLCVASPDDAHFAPIMQGLDAGCHILVEKPSVLSLEQTDQILKRSIEAQKLVRVVYHKLADPDHKRLRTLVSDGVLNHVNSGYCTLLEPKSIGMSTFAAWIQGRNPATYVAVHYFKLIDFTFGGATVNPAMRLKKVEATGQKGQVSRDPATWDSVQSRLTYAYPDGSEAVFDIHTSWVHPDNFPGYVDQEVQFRFHNGVWNASQRKRGIELVVEGKTPTELKTNINNHYNATTLDPWGSKRARGYGLEVIERFFDETAHVLWDGDQGSSPQRLDTIRGLAYADLGADRSVIAMVEATEAILAASAAGQRGGVVEVNGPQGGLVLKFPGTSQSRVLYAKTV